MREHFLHLWTVVMCCCGFNAILKYIECLNFTWTKIAIYENTYALVNLIVFITFFLRFYAGQKKHLEYETLVDHTAPPNKLFIIRAAFLTFHLTFFCLLSFSISKTEIFISGMLGLLAINVIWLQTISNSYLRHLSDRKDVGDYLLSASKWTINNLVTFVAAIVIIYLNQNDMPEWIISLGLVNSLVDYAWTKEFYILTPWREA